MILVIDKTGAKIYSVLATVIHGSPSEATIYNIEDDKTLEYMKKNIKNLKKLKAKIKKNKKDKT